MSKLIIASDNFTRANGAIGSNWSASLGTAWSITSNQADGGTNNPGYERWVGAGSFANNQYSIVTIGPSAAVHYTYFGVVLNDNGTNFYTLIVYGFGDYFLEKNGATLIFAAAPLLAVGDTIELDNVGGVLTGYHNGVPFVTYTDATPLTGGTPGMACLFAGQDAFYSNWVGGNIVSTFSISGSTGIAGTTVSYTGTSSGSVTSGVGGAYTIPGLAPGAYTITPTQTGYTFSPTSANETLTTSNITGVNFTPAPTTFSISGNVGVAGVTVSYTGPSSGSVISGAGGAYTISGLANGTYIITPTLAGYIFTPTSTIVVVNGSNVTGTNFIGSQYYSVPDCRDTNGWPNNSVNVQRTLQYTVQKHDSRKAGAPVDSRKNKPVDSRVFPNIPGNSRTDPPFES